MANDVNYGSFEKWWKENGKKSDITGAVKKYAKLVWEHKEEEIQDFTNKITRLENKIKELKSRIVIFEAVIRELAEENSGGVFS